jgi:hypothetical protein
MATQLPEELHEIVARSLTSAKELQMHISNFNGTITDESGLMTALIQAHTAHLLNHSSIIRHVTTAYGSKGSNAALQSVVAAGERMIEDTRQLQEYLVVSEWQRTTAGAEALTDGIKGLRVQKDRGAHRPTTPAPAPRDYRAPTVEASEDETDARPTNDNDISPPPSARNVNPLKSKQKTDKAIPTVEADALRSSPKRRLGDEDELPTQAMVKRTKLSPAPPKDAKRKSDVSMLDVEEIDDHEATSPGKRQKKSSEHESEQAVTTPQVEYEDITAEVDARMHQTEQRKKREKKQELGVVDKRKRQSNDSIEIELQREEANEVEKPLRKRKKKRHSGLLEG